MDWDLKMPSWDFSELDPNIGPDMGPMAGPSTGISVRADDGPLDLKLGGDFVQQRAVEPATTNSPSGSSKRARTPGPSGSPSMVACLVDGCIADLSNCREYHRRHKVCAGHSKTPVVMVRGQEQRFCQQCSRFHLLVEFDEGKRSCRKRLDGHNRRRRKPQPEPISSGSLFANHQGNRFAASSQIFPSTVSDPSWLDTMKPENPPFFARQQPVHFFDSQHHFFRSSFAPSFTLQDSDPQVCHSLKSSDCALSLLSSSPPPPRPPTSAINQPPMLSYPGALVLGQYSSGSRQTLLDHASESATGFSCSRMEDDENVAELSCQGLFGEGSSDGGQSLPFSWE